MITQCPDWPVAETDKLTPDLLHMLFENKIAGIRMPRFLTEGHRRAATRQIWHQRLTYYEHVDPPIRKLGVTQFEHQQDDWSRARYFQVAKVANALRAEMFAACGDPLELVLDALTSAWPQPAAQARDTHGQEYFAGLVRVIDEALMHCDWAPRDAPGWSISDVTAQITWNLYYQMPDSGGATVVYNAPWEPVAEAHLVPGSYGYASDLVAGRSQTSITPHERDLIFFNSRNFHSIESGTGQERVTVSSFIGRKPDGTLVLWS